MLAREYDVSRETLRRALDALLESCLITKQRGIGNIVSKAIVPCKQVTLVGRLDNFCYQVLSRRRVRIAMADAAVVASLQLSPGDTLLDRLEVVALSSGQAYAYSMFYFPQSIGAQLSTEELGGSVPILQVVEARTSQTVSWADQTVEPVLANAKIVRHLGIKARLPILQMRRTYYTAAGLAIESAVVRYHPDRHTYSAQLLANP